LRRDPKAHKLSTMIGGRTPEQWIAQYASSHQHPVNRFCHTLGIPLIVVSIAWFAIAWLMSASLTPSIMVFAMGWILQFVGHAFEKKLPEFFHDWRFLFVGLRWWVAKIRGRA
jgi:uncharacterized membrane protein YGL010W